ncbi:MAG: NAD(P)/FAD-dependent oxidoreductase [Synergistaceae bacterium]|jgi:NADPH-dependent 2,4-dienoyl-CoA reductase/sulfur reductase-like enzyme|nr:NAD(P)/FAD-dependent oxidoreductase [Synergistaceae bacterium]
MTDIARRGVVVAGGGPAGLAAAIAAKEAGCGDVVIVERDALLGGILNQCIHDGFGLYRFKEALSGPEYAARFIDRIAGFGIDVELGTIVLDISPEGRLLLSARGEMREVDAGAVVLATGCRERPRGAVSIPGHRPSGVYTAGAAQRFVNIENIMPGRSVVILGSGDIGLIMARRMTLEGARVEAVIELMPYSSGLPRNIQQCLVDYGIPLCLSAAVVETVGMGRLEGVRVADVGADLTPIPGTERFIPCDTLLLSVGLIPENELARAAGAEMNPLTGGPMVDDRCMTSVPGIFSCGNALHVHDIVDWVSEEAERAGRFAALYAAGEDPGGGPRDGVRLVPGRGVRYVAPSRMKCGAGRDDSGVLLAFRVLEPSRNGVIEVGANGTVILEERRSRLHPAEMIRIALSSADVARVRGLGAGVLEVRVR